MVLISWQLEHYWLRYDTFCQFGGNGNGEKKWAKSKRCKKKAVAVAVAGWQ
jgi:hypothetical protein